MTETVPSDWFVTKAQPFVTTMLVGPAPTVKVPTTVLVAVSITETALAP